MVGDGAEADLLAMFAQRAAHGQINVVLLCPALLRHILDVTVVPALPIGTANLDRAAPGPSRASAPGMEAPSPLRRHGGGGREGKTVPKPSYA